MKNNCMPTSIYQQCHFHINQTHTHSHHHCDHHHSDDDDHPHRGVHGGGHGRGGHAPAHVWCWTSAARCWPLLTENRLAGGVSIILLYIIYYILTENRLARGFSIILLLLLLLLTENRLARGFWIINQIDCGLAVMAVDVNLPREAWRSYDLEYKNNKPNYVDSVGGCA